jgi:hypothetical protein
MTPSLSAREQTDLAEALSTWRHCLDGAKRTDSPIRFQTYLQWCAGLRQEIAWRKGYNVFPRMVPAANYGPYPPRDTLRTPRAAWQPNRHDRKRFSA